jgi:hypothetical protein
MGHIDLATSFSVFFFRECLAVNVSHGDVMEEYREQEIEKFLAFTMAK